MEFPRHLDVTGVANFHRQSLHPGQAMPFPLLLPLAAWEVVSLDLRCRNSGAICGNNLFLVRENVPAGVDEHFEPVHIVVVIFLVIAATVSTARADQNCLRTPWSCVPSLCNRQFFCVIGLSMGAFRPPYGMIQMTM